MRDKWTDKMKNEYFIERVARKLIVHRKATLKEEIGLGKYTHRYWHNTSEIAIKATEEGKKKERGRHKRGVPEADCSERAL